MKNSGTDNKKKMLVIGIGNNGRGDDGLGWCFADRVAKAGMAPVDCEYRYQLQVEDAALIAGYGVVVFVDASHQPLEAGYEIKNCDPAPHYFFSSHAQSPQTILYLAHELYQRSPEAYTLAIAGKEWGMATRLSQEAEDRLAAAFAHFKNVWLTRLLQRFAPLPAPVTS